MDPNNQGAQNVQISSNQLPQSLPNPSSARPKMSFKNILKLVIGLLSVLAIGIILFIFVLPNFNKKEEKIKLSFWGLYEDPSVFSPVISQFEKENPNIDVVYEKEDIKDYRERLTTRGTQGTGPDIFRFHNTWYSQLKNLLLPLPRDVITKDEFSKIYYPVAQGDLIKNGAIYAVPLDMDVLSLFINSDIFKNSSFATPQNWNDFVNVARGLTVKDSTGKIATAGAAFGTYDNVSHAPDIFSLLMAQDGVDVNNLYKSPDRVGDALSFYTAFALGDSSVWDASLDQSRLLFSKGKLAMFFGYYWDYFTIKSNNQALHFNVVPVPQLSFPNVQIASYYPLGISATSKHQKEAFLFFKFLIRKDIQNQIYQEEAKIRSYGEPPGRIDLADNFANTPLSNFVKAKDATSSYLSGETEDNGLNEDFNKLLSTAISSILQGGAPKDAGNTLSTSFSQLLAKYKIL